MKLKLTPSQQRVVESHRHKITRRDLMGLGIQGAMAFVTLQSFKSKLLLGENFAASLPAFMVVDLVGGAALPGNFLVTDAAGEMLPAYNTLGYNPKTSQMDNRFGLAAPKTISRMFEGIIATTSAEAQSRLKISSIAHLGVDDSDNNSHSALGLAAKYYSDKGQLQQKGLGSFGTNSGGRTRLSLDDARFRPEQLVKVSQLNLLSGLYSFNAAGIKDQNLNQFVQAQKNLYLDQFKSLASDEQAELKENFEEQMDTYYSAAVSTVVMDPRKIDVTKQLYNINDNTQDTNAIAIQAGMVYACLQGFVGPSCLALDGFDYHDGTATTGDAADQRAGQALGRIIELAHRLQKKVFVQVISDGSCSSSNTGREWLSDSGQRSLCLMLSYDPNGAVEQVHTQIGHYTKGQIADTSTYPGQKSAHVANVAFINYLTSMGADAEIEKYFSVGELPSELIKKLTAFVA